MSNWKELWLKNYEEKEGDTKNLSEYAKTLDFGAKKSGRYLPWAVPERIFKLQDGEYELLRDEEGRTVETETFVSRESIDENTGEIITRYGKMCFINIKVTWQGRTHIERYPIQDSSARPLTTFTQNDINNSFQRGKTKAIAIVSGIGYSMFENERDMSDNEENQEPDKVEKQIKKIKELGAKAKKVEEHDFKPKVEVIEKPTKTPNDELFEEELKKEVEDKKEPEVVEVEAVLVKEMDPEERIDIIEKLKGKFISSKEDGDKIKEFLNKVNIKKFDDLSNDQLIELADTVL